MVQNKSNLKEPLGSNGNKKDKPQNTYFLSLELENIRCFSEKQKIDFSNKGKPRQWTIILGDNGTGKTTLLQALVSIQPEIIEIPDITNLNEVNLDKITPMVYALYAENQRLKLIWDVGNSRSKDGHYISAKFFAEQRLLNNSKGKIFELSHQGVRLSASIEPEVHLVNLFAYGAGRKINDSLLLENSRGEPWETLFLDNSFLSNPKEWLLRADYSASKLSRFQKRAISQFEKVKEVLLKVLPDVDEIRFKQGAEAPYITKVEFKTKYGWVEFHELSLGYRTSMAWVVDLASRMFDLYPETKNPLTEPAVVLIDEIDLHLHPKWQRDLLPWLSEIFPNTQFIVTTHSPLIVQSAVARDANIVVCRREGDHVVIDQSIEAVRNWRADQILTSDLFGLETARPKKIEPFLEEREKILSKAKLTKKDEKRLSKLEDEIGYMPVSENPEDDKAMDIIRRAAERLESQAK